MNDPLEPSLKTLLDEYSLLSSSHNQLKLSYDRLQKYSRHLEEENLALRKLLADQNIPQTVESSRISKLLNKSLTSDLTSADLQTSRTNRSLTIEKPPEIPAKVQSPHKTPQPKPDSGVESESSTYLFEAFFVIGAQHSTFKSVPVPVILYEYLRSDHVTAAMKSVIPSMALPKVVPEPLTLTGSASNLNNLIFGQVPNKRNEDCFTFTLRATDSGPHEICSELPNATHEIIYFTCLLINDLAEYESEEFICPKCYILASFIPSFDLHFEILCSVLLLKRLHRMELMQTLDSNSVTFHLSNIDVTSKGVEMLEELKTFTMDYGVEVEVGRKGMDALSYKFTDDLARIDIEWLCIPLFSSLKPQDLCWLVAALIQEKSIIFMSGNLGLLTACVLGMRALIRPFNWTNLTIPLIPDNLKELLEAPVPILAGVSHMDAKLRYKNTSIIWVLIDEEEINHRIQYSCYHVNEVVDLDIKVIQKVEKYYWVNKGGVFEKARDGHGKARKIVRIFERYWKNVMRKFSRKNVRNSKMLKKVVEKFEEGEQKFVAALVKTQVFANSVEMMEG